MEYELNSVHTYQQKVGFAYEYFVLEKIRKDYEQVWHWKNFPEMIMGELGIIQDPERFKNYRYDYGADLVAYKNSTYYFIQCKNYTHGKIDLSCLAGFIALLHTHDLNGILYYDGELSSRLTNINYKFPIIKLPYNNQLVLNKQINDIVYTPRNYQTEAYNKLKGQKSGILNLPCGMGKTYTSYLLAKDYNNIIIMCPLKCLAAQALKVFNNLLNQEYEPILVSSDGTRDIEEIKTHIKTKNIFSSTYDSADILVKLLDTITNPLIIIDEFHNLSDTQVNNNQSDMNKLLSSPHNKLYLSATPPANFAGEHITYTYSWADAIANKYICDFSIMIPDTSDKMDAFTELIKKSFGEISDHELIIKLYFMLSSMRYNGNTKCICYLTSINLADKAYKIMDWLPNLLGIKTLYWKLDCKTSKSSREKILNEFKQTTDMSIILNVHILDEGIDIPVCDSVFITQPSYNMINIVQRMCRANRITDNKKRCNIYLWCKEKKTQDILNYIYANTNNYTKDKIQVYNTTFRTIHKYEVIKDLNDNKTNKLNFEQMMPTDRYLNKLTFREFIDKNKLINIDFMNDFSNIISDDYMDKFTEFLIDSELIRKWLRIRNRKGFNDTIKRSYRKNLDYIVANPSKHTGRGGHNLEIITFTPTAARKICFSSSSKYNSEIQQHFMDLETALFKYKNYIIN